MDLPDISKKVGKRIKELRLERRFSQQDLAAACNFEKSNLARIEAGRTNPTIGTLAKISQALDVHISELFDFSEKEGS